MRPATGRAAVVLVLAFWILGGPVGMAFVSCASMCDGSCAPATDVPAIPQSASLMPFSAPLRVPAVGHPPTGILRVEDPPPKSFPA